MAQAFISTPGGNLYPDENTSYDQSEAFRVGALNRDTVDSTIRGLAEAGAALAYADAAAYADDVGDEAYADAAAHAEAQDVLTEASAVNLSRNYTNQQVTLDRTRLSGIEKEIRRNVLPEGADLNHYVNPSFNGSYGISTPYLPSYLNLPPGMNERGTFECISPNMWTVTHRVTPRTGTIKYERVMSGPTGPVFEPWQVIDSSPPPTPADVTPALPTSDWVHCGDSLTEGVGLATADKWVTKLAAKTGRNHLNEGWSGQLAAQIAARQGGNPALVTVSGGSIPASGTGVLVTAATPHISIPVGTQYPTRQVPGKLAGRTGYLTDGGSADVTDATFTPTDGQGASTATGSHVFTPTGSADDGRNRVMTICVGENDIYGTGQHPQQVAYLARQMHDYQSTFVKRVLVLSIPLRAGSGSNTSTGRKTLAINAALKAEFPSQYVDLSEYLMTDQAATDAGITFTASDREDIADGVTPRAFRFDSVHFNALGSTIVAEYVYQSARSRGWV